VRAPVVALGSAIVACALAHEARADVAVDGQVTGSATVGVTDNVANTPTPAADAPAGTPTPEADGFGTVSPAAELQLETADATQTLGYVFSYTFYFAHPEANTVQNSLAYGLRAPVSDRTTFLMGLTASQTNVATFNLATASAVTPIGGNAGGNNLLFTLAASQGVESELSETVLFTETLGGQFSQTIVDEAEDQKTILGSLAFGLTKTFEQNTLGGTFGTDAQVIPGTTPETGEGTPTSAQIVHHVGGDWGHQFDPDWSTSLGAGVVVGYDAALGGTPVVHPTGHAAVTFHNERGDAALDYAHGAVPNVLLRQITLNDTVSLRGLLLLGASGFDVGASGAFTATRSFISDAGIGSPGYAVLADAAIGWVPGASIVRLEARYQFTRQFASPPDAAGFVALPELSRHAGLFTITFGWPGSPEAGGAAPFVSLPPPTVSPDFLQHQAPESERAVDQKEKEEKDHQEHEHETRGGAGSE
jgi:hypothetical protein